MATFKRANPSALQEQLEKLTQKNSFDSNKEHEWTLSTDPATGNGQAIIRFLPANPNIADSVPFVKLYSHGFKMANGKWFIENCPSTIGLPCPICEHNGSLWNSGIEQDKEVAKKQKRKIRYYANVLVVKDPTNPENNGKVKVFSFGQKIMDKIIAQAAGDAELGTPGQDVTCVFTGSNFVLKAKKVAGFANYDDSKFLPASEIENINDEAYANELIAQMYNIMDYISPDKFKSAEELTAKFQSKTNGTVKSAAAELEESISGNSSFDAAMTEYESKSTSGSTNTVSDDELEALLNG